MEEIKNNFVKIKSLISQKRKPEDKVDKIIKGFHACESVQIKKEKYNKYDDDKEEKKEENIKKKANNKKVKIFIKSIKKVSKKKRSKRIENKNIDSYFDKKGIKKEKDIFVDNNINKILTIDHYMNKTKDEINSKEYLHKINEEINNNFSILKGKKIKYNSNFIKNIYDIPHTIKDFYSLDSKTINENNKNKYLSILKNYFIKYNSLKNIDSNNKINFQNKKLIFIHSSLNKIKQIPTETSKKINPRNYLIKDEYLIDYDKDSEDEYIELNAEDIKSNDNDDEEEELLSLSLKDTKEFIVPDGHLSQSELSDCELIEQRRLFQKSKQNLIDIKSFLNIRKNYIKPILIDFTKKENNDKIKILCNKLTIGLFRFDYDEDNENSIYENEETFPIVIKKKTNNYKGVQNSIKNNFEDIIKIIHGSYETKEYLINEINQKFNNISKNILNNFFKDKCLKIHKKYWIVKDEILKQFNFNLDDLEKIKILNYNKYKEKEEKKEKELEIIEQKDEIINSKNEDPNIEINNTDSKVKNDILDIKKSQKLDKILINTKEFEGFTIEILESDSNTSNNNELINHISDNKHAIDLNQNEDNNLIIGIEGNCKKSGTRKKKSKAKKSKKIIDEESSDIDYHDNKRKSTRIKRNNNLSLISENSKIGKMRKFEKTIRIEDNSSDENTNKSKSRCKNKSRKKNINNKSINDFFNIKGK